MIERAVNQNDGPGGRVFREIDERVAFRDALTVELGMPVVRRYSGGKDVEAACGMLRWISG